MSRRTRYQQGSVQREKRRSGPDVWVFRWREVGEALHPRIEGQGAYCTRDLCLLGVTPQSKSFRLMAGTTGLEPATSAVTGQRSNQLSYVPRV